jgi:carotenoid cleavage dioxygenase-like enzyme
MTTQLEKMTMSVTVLIEFKFKVVFHPSSSDADEDDGVLMGYVSDRPTDRSELAILGREL